MELLTARRIKIFAISFIATFAMVAIANLGIAHNDVLSMDSLFTKAQQIISPQPAKTDIFDSITPRLEAKPASFQLKQNRSLVTKAYAGADYEELPAYGVIDLDTGDVLMSKSLSDKHAIASITKLMTAVVALDLANPQELMSISEHAASIEPTKIGVVPGQQMTLSELLDAGLLTSANDAIEVIREGIDVKYGEAVFIRAMNEKARILGMNHSHFQNPQGFDHKEHYSSIEDLGLLTKYAITNYPMIADIVKKEYQFLPANDHHKQYDLYNWNGLLGVYPGASGVKIGNTDDAGRTTIVTATRGSRTLAVIVLGAPGILERDQYAADLLDEGFQQFGLTPIQVTQAQLKEKYASWKYWN
jgi:serine-type D-Ala-D-Ala carboxypeptidase (penicillin-binding protein 5/6)